jgi:hypothetical protein
VIRPVPRYGGRAAVWSLAIGIVLAGARDARGAAAGVPAPRELKRLEQQVLIGELATAREERAAAIRRLSRDRRPPRHAVRGPRAPASRGGAAAGTGGPPVAEGPPRAGPHGRAGERLTFPHDAHEPPRPSPTTVRAPAATTTPVNVRCNDRRHDVISGSTQSEVVMAARGPLVVAAWNDGEGVNQFDMMGWGWSQDGGATWTDGGPLPLGDSLGWWLSDPILTVDPHSGTFVLGGLVITRRPANGIAVLRGRLRDGTFQWDPPIVTRQFGDTLPDKPWIAADSLTGTVHLVYTTFESTQGHTTDEIEYQQSPDGGRTWSAWQRLSSDTDAGLVQGARCAVGPDGDVWVAWTAVDTSASDGADYIRVRHASRDGPFGPEATAAHLYANFSSGGPGFNRGYGFAWPSLAVDRSRGRHRGRVHIAWNESINFFNDALGGGGVRAEREPNGGPANASPLTIGETVVGEVRNSNDVDWYRFDGLRGQTAVFYLDSVATDLDVSMRIVCGDGTRLAFNAPARVRHRMAIFTLPTTGTYYLYFSPNDTSGGGYRVRTGWHAAVPGERARDHRDVFATWSDDGQRWAEPVRVNGEPGWFDDWLPEVAVSPDGTVWACWYDWREAPATTCGGESGVYVARSGDGGVTWRETGPVADALTAWSLVSSNIVPNHGDYVSLIADERGVLPCWADGRNDDPDVYMARLPAPMRIDPIRAVATAGGVSLAWSAPAAGGTTAALYRRLSTGAWDSLATLVTLTGDSLVYLDPVPGPGVRVSYRLGVMEGDSVRFAGDVTVDVPPPLPPHPRLAGVWPNPVTGVVHVRLALPGRAPARLTLYDALGRQVRELSLAAPGWQEVTMPLGVRPGRYLLVLEQDHQRQAAPLTVLR